MGILTPLNILNAKYEGRAINRKKCGFGRIESGWFDPYNTECKNDKISYIQPHSNTLQKIRKRKNVTNCW